MDLIIDLCNNLSILVMNGYVGISVGLSIHSIKYFGPVKDFLTTSGQIHMKFGVDTEGQDLLASTTVSTKYLLISMVMIIII